MQHVFAAFGAWDAAFAPHSRVAKQLRCSHWVFYGACTCKGCGCTNREDGSDCACDQADGKKRSSGQPAKDFVVTAACTWSARHSLWYYW